MYLTCGNLTVNAQISLMTIQLDFFLCYMQLHSIQNLVVFMPIDWLYVIQKKYAQYTYVLRFNQDTCAGNSLMFAGINVCVFDTKPHVRRDQYLCLAQALLIIQVHELCLRVFISAIKDGRELRQINPSQILTNLQDLFNNV